MVVIKQSVLPQAKTVMKDMGINTRYSVDTYSSLNNEIDRQSQHQMQEAQARGELSTVNERKLMNSNDISWTLDSLEKPKDIVQQQMDS